MGVWSRICDVHHTCEPQWRLAVADETGLSTGLSMAGQGVACETRSMGDMRGAS